MHLHNLSIKLWDGEALDSIIEPIGRLLKVDEFSSCLARNWFAKVCLEINLSIPLRRGFWFDDEDGKVFVLILFECLPTFCYHCGFFRHGSNTCSHR